MKRKNEPILLLPSLFGFFIFYIIPFLYSFYYAFTVDTFTKSFAGFSNFRSLFNSRYFQLALKNTIIFIVVSVPLIMVLSIVIALIIARYLNRFPFIKNSFFLPVLLPSATIVMIWQVYFTNISPFLSLIILFLWKYIGLNIMLVLTALIDINNSILEASRIDGAGIFRTTWYVTLPNITPILLFTFVISLINSMKIYRESYIMWGNYPDTSVYMIQNYLNNHFAKLNYQNISSAAIMFFIYIYFIVTIVFILEKKKSEDIW